MLEGEDVDCGVGVIENGLVVVCIAVASPDGGAADSSIEISDITDCSDAIDMTDPREVYGISAISVKELYSFLRCILDCVSCMGLIKSADNFVFTQNSAIKTRYFPCFLSTLI